MSEWKKRIKIIKRGDIKRTLREKKILSVRYVVRFLRINDIKFNTT